MSPREIQARVRAGASPEVVASETGWPLDKVTRYAEPPLGERAYMAEQARDVEISRSRGGSTLHQSVCTRLSVDPEGTDVTWDSYRADDGRWVVTAYHAHQGVGTWYYEAVGRTVHLADASARALMGGGPTEVADDAPPRPAPEPVATPTPPADANEQSDTDRCIPSRSGRDRLRTRGQILPGEVDVGGQNGIVQGQFSPESQVGGGRSHPQPVVHVLLRR